MGGGREGVGADRRAGSCKGARRRQRLARRGRGRGHGRGRERGRERSRPIDPGGGEGGVHCRRVANVTGAQGVCSSRHTDPVALAVVNLGCLFASGGSQRCLEQRRSRDAASLAAGYGGEVKLHELARVAARGLRTGGVASVAWRGLSAGAAARRSASGSRAGEGDARRHRLHSPQAARTWSPRHRPG